MSDHDTAVMVGAKPSRRGTSSKDVQGNSTDRRRRREWLLLTYRADVDLRSSDVHGVEAVAIGSPLGVEAGLWGDVTTEMACRCYRCGRLLTLATLTVDRIVPGCLGGKYVRENCRPACGPCNSETGGALATRGNR